MFKKSVNLLFVLLTVAMLPTQAEAQGSKPWKSWYGHIAGGYTDVTGEAGKVFNNGWNINGGATYKPSSWPLGLNLELAYNDFGMTKDAREFFEASGGDGSVGSFTAGAIWVPDLDGQIGFNIQAGVGAYYVEARLKEPGYVCGPICDPFYPWWCWWGCTPGNVITDSRSATKFGYNIGAAITFELDSGSIIYLEAKYHWVDTELATKYMPIVIGYRW